MTKPLNLDALERDWTEGNFDDELDAVRAAQRTIPILIDELRAARKVVEAAEDVGRAFKRGEPRDDPAPLFSMLVARLLPALADYEVSKK